MSSLCTKCASAAITLITAAAVAQTAPITLSVDLTDAPRKILHATEVMPVSPGPLTVVYPEWIPGEHGPTGPIDNMAGILHHRKRSAHHLGARQGRHVRLSPHRPPGRQQTRDEDRLPRHRLARRLLRRCLHQRKSRAPQLEHPPRLPRRRQRQRRHVHPFHHHPRWMEVRHRARRQRHDLASSPPSKP